MNAQVLLDWALDITEESAERFKSPPWSRWPDLKETMRELHRQADEDPEAPKISTKNPERTLEELREHYRDDVGKISLELRHRFPNQYLYYRPSRMEPEIFEGLRFLGAVCPEFAELKPVGRTGVARYLELNRALWTFAREVWPGVNDPQTRLTTFLCRVLAPLFSDDREGERHWIFATGERYFEELDADEGNEWSGHREMAEGDLTFIYRMAPQKAITDLFVTAGPPFCDPLNYWDVMVPIKRLARIQPITFADLRTDRVLGDWSVIRRRFQGVRCEPIPDLYFNRLVELLPCTIRRKFGLEPVPISTMGRAGNYGTEAEFSVEVVEKLFKQCGLPIDPQWPCPVRVGHQVIVGRADYQVRDGRAPLTVVECKLRIRSDGSVGNLDLDRTIDQAKSYALHLGLPSFVVASPEGFWVYSLERNQHKLELRIPGDRWEDRAGELKRLLLEIRDRK